ncbi:hypothetical protein MPTK1_3g03140 [Marchantia polymorpha subsp. ruderalis]|uniref:Bulb-type lectin domain-containing protein n=2 Tax=Marchantia polymorpha TaxID=3197 RepID=A0A176W399_MARPO|nr:hypothetical protein AXG93_2277s1050 [Marchantia polymorpha subsp. ruderalis]PTQ27236.1 hypothetical protein MARPO_0212s0012 [Marchantia polymorpha]BBN04263.1 hypothetical protein Mp_3g03140 [Marchantia polymorpha subsp. ruderalis]|eukprot:PTQ27236.1 hypothetical protein MARPO_0212s0012 [Marchantia polymorpha]
MVSGIMARSSLLWLVHILVLCALTTVHAQNDKFVYKFSSGDMVCKNSQAGVSCTNPPRSAMNTAGFSPSHHNIISFNADGNYALGFETATSGSVYLSIYSYNPRDKSAGPFIWRAATSSGVHVQVPAASSLKFSKSGNIELIDTKGVVQWTPMAAGLGVTDFQFNFRKQSNAIAGNMLLYNQDRQVVWQSIPDVEKNSFKFDMEHRPDMVCTNQRQGVQCTPPLEYPMHPSKGSDSHRNLISLDINGLYALGFEKSTRGFHLSIYPWSPIRNTAGPAIWRAATRGANVLVDERGTFTFSHDGALELKDSHNKLVWTTNTQGKASDLNFNLDSGELRLYNVGRSIVWSSAERHRAS